MSRLKRISTLLAAGLVAGSLEVSAAGVPVNTAAGVLVDANGMTLYTFDKDPAGGGKSLCNGPCAKNWPPVAASKSDHGSGQYSIITRDDGSAQWAFNGKPLYLWVKDAKPGDKTGDGVKGVWHLAKP